MRFNNNEKLLYLIYNYFKNLEKNEEITKYLYNHTELFEQKYMEDFQSELFRFFSGKIGTYARQRNTLLKLLTTKQKEDLTEIEILEN